ncbi:jg14783, partial [Pararge aegeria aegeria]
MEYQDQADYNNIIDVIISTFGEVLSRDVLYNIVENFGGD